MDRLTEFGVADQRATLSRSVVEIHPCRELIPDEVVRQRAPALVAEQEDREALQEIRERGAAKRASASSVSVTLRRAASSSVLG